MICKIYNENEIQKTFLKILQDKHSPEWGNRKMCIPFARRESLDKGKNGLHARVKLLAPGHDG